MGYKWVKTDRDWHFAVMISKVRACFVLLYLEVFPSNQTDDKDACDENAYDEDACDDDASDEVFNVYDLEEYASDEDDYVEDGYAEDTCDANSMDPFTKESILSLNNGSVTFEQARALLNVNLSTFTARLEQLNIFTWKEVNGSIVRIQEGDYEITIIIKDMGKFCTVRATDSFKGVICMLDQ
nr:flavone 6-hydroxylase [Tanacetum cinerariifolium]